jgi:hypothetical protein
MRQGLTRVRTSPGAGPSAERPALAFADVKPILVRRERIADSVVVVGGQAVDFWAELYAPQLPAIDCEAPFTSNDIDFCGGVRVVRICADRLEGTAIVATIDDHTPARESYLRYYHGARTHFSLAKDAPDSRSFEPAELGRACCCLASGRWPASPLHSLRRVACWRSRTASSARPPRGPQQRTIFMSPPPLTSTSHSAPTTSTKLPGPGCTPEPGFRRT